MSSYTKIKILLTLLIACVLGVMTYNFLEEYETEVDIVVAKVDISEQKLIDPAAMLEIKRTSLNVKNQYMKQSANSLDYFKDTISKVKIPAGTVLDTSTHVVKTDGSVQKDESGNPISSGVSQSFFINVDERLLAIKLEPDACVNNTLKKGDMVDILASFEKEADKPEKETLILAQRVAVFDVQSLGEDNKEPAEQNIILKVSLKQAGEVIWMKRHGKIDLILSSAKAISQPAIPVTQMTILKGNYGSSN